MGALGNVSEHGEQGKPIVASWPLGVRLHIPDATIAEQFKAAGYDSALIGKWHIHTAPELLGFDYTLHPRVNHRHTGQEFVENGGRPQVVNGFSVEYEIERVLDYLAAERDNPFFLFYSISPPHMPLADAPDEYLSMHAPEDVPLRPYVFVDGRMAHDEEWFRIYLWDFLYNARKLPHTLELPDGFDLAAIQQVTEAANVSHKLPHQLVDQAAVAHLKVWIGQVRLAHIGAQFGQRFVQAGGRQHLLDEVFAVEKVGVDPGRATLNKGAAFGGELVIVHGESHLLGSPQRAQVPDACDTSIPSPTVVGTRTMNSALSGQLKATKANSNPTIRSSGSREKSGRMTGPVSV